MELLNLMPKMKFISEFVANACKKVSVWGLTK